MAEILMAKSSTNHRINLLARMAVAYKTHQVVVPALTIMLNTRDLRTSLMVSVNINVSKTKANNEKD